ncbi:hybrid sensor histidine kinase/response regulator [bacterium]|nr:hybrid sensor histidine kinase/response regulator [bacterium]
MDFSDNELTEILNIFQVEAEDIISKMNNSLLDLERNPKNKELILLLFRNAHSLKGAARMIGFNSIQTLAHKMEDILDLAQENKLILNTKISDILYKTVDMIDEIIKNSISSGQEIADMTEVNEQINILDNIKSVEEQNINATKETMDYNRTLLHNSIEKLNSLIVNTLICLMKLEENCEPEMIDRMSNYVNRMFDLFNDIGFFEIKMSIENTKLKLDFVKQASYNLTTLELIEMQDDMANVINVLSSMYELNNIPVVDYYSYAFEKISKPSQQYEEFVFVQKAEEKKQEEQEEYLDGDKEPQEETDSTVTTINFATVKEKIPSLETDITDIYEIREFFEHLGKNCENENASKMISEIVKILKYSEKTSICPNEQALMIISGAIDYLDELLNNGNDTGNFDLLFQQLEIMMQLLDMTNIADADAILDLPQVQAVPAKTKTNSDFSKIFNTNEIKTLHVDSNKLDVLINQLGELITTKTKTTKQLTKFSDIVKEMEYLQKDLMDNISTIKTLDKKISNQSSENLTMYLKQTSNTFMDNYKRLADLINEINQLQRTHRDDDDKLTYLIEDLSSMVKNIRVLPFATVFHFFGRMVRDIAKERNKKVELIINGSDTNADKNIIEEIKNPLIHIVRNAIDHGIESPEKRMALGKNPTGKITINALHSDNKIILEVIDDGQGFNIEQIKETAIIKEFVTQDELNQMTEDEIINMVFWPGFTTDDKVTDISGRGIGLDVVKSKMMQLNGQIKLITDINRGSCIRLELPLTMSTMNALVIKSAKKLFAIPMANIVTVISKPLDEIFINDGQATIVYNEKNISVYNLSTILDIETKEEILSNKKTIMIVESDNKIIGLIADELVGTEEVLNKKLAPPIQKVKNISGVTALASGEICLILNVSDIMRNSMFLSNKTIAAEKVKMLEYKSNKNKINKKILVVDDSVIVRTLTKNILSMEGFNVETVFNPIEALKKLKQSHYDAIITDIEMPELNGFEFLEQLKKDKMKANIPVVVMSSNDEEEYKERAKTLGAADYIVKNSFKQPAFIKYIKDLLSK